MGRRLQLFMIAISILVFLAIVHYIRKSRLTTQMAVIWILWSMGLIIISIFPQISYSLVKLLGIVTTMNGVFIIMIFIVYCLVFFLYLKVSILETKLNALVQDQAIRNKEDAER